jgi:ribosomal-protein-serine acetyltransferase
MPSDPTRVRMCPQEFASKRLCIRMPLGGDGAAIVEAVAESIDELSPWLPWAQSVRSVEECEEHIRAVRLAFASGEDFPLYLFDRASGALVGGTGFHRPDWSVPSFEIGYWIRTSQTRRGFATEAVRALAEVGFRDLGAQRIEIHMSDDNVASRRVAEAAGFELEGVLRRAERHLDGSLRDTRVYARIASA